MAQSETALDNSLAVVIGDALNTQSPVFRNAIVQVTGSSSRALAGCLLFAG